MTTERRQHQCLCGYLTPPSIQIYWLRGPGPFALPYPSIPLCLQPAPIPARAGFGLTRSPTTTTPSDSTPTATTPSSTYTATRPRPGRPTHGGHTTRRNLLGSPLSNTPMETPPSTRTPAHFGNGSRTPTDLAVLRRGRSLNATRRSCPHAVGRRTTVGLQPSEAPLVPSVSEEDLRIRDTWPPLTPASR